jgi:FkbM family methyltransferase
MKPLKVIAAAGARRFLLPLVPARQKLGFTFWLNRMSGSFEPELLHLDDYIAGTRTAIDIGANIGMYTYALSKRFQRVIAFEINEKITAAIRQYNPGTIELIHCGLSSGAARAQFYIPVSSGIEQAGWASLNRDNLPGAEKLIEFEVELKPLDEFGLNDVDFVKIDVEGHEVEVLKGAVATLEKWRPMVLIELKQEHVQEVDAWFRKLDYKHCRLEDFAGVRGHRSNYIYTPMERLAKFGIARPED